jgi:hypothetical protein
LVKQNFSTTFELADFVDFVFSNVYVLELKLSDENEAVHVFSVMNNRGLDLDPADLIKNHLFQKIVDDQKFNEVSDDWDKASQALFNARLKRLRSMQFLLKAMIGVKKGESISSDDIYDEWVKYLKTPSDAEDFAKSLPHEAVLLQRLSTAETPAGKSNELVYSSNLFNWTQHLEVLMAGKHLSANSFDELSRIVDARVILSQFSNEKN